MQPRPVFLCSHAGTVWWDDGVAGSCDSGRRGDQFIRSGLPVPASAVYLCHDETDLVTRLLEPGGPVARVFVSPCNHVPAGQHPRAVLARLWYMVAADSGHFWHEVTRADLPAYRMTAAVSRMDYASAVTFLPRHPAWPAVAFIPGFSVESSCALLTLIGDARFFVHPYRLTRMSRLHRFFGINGTDAGERLFDASPGRNIRRFRLAASSWLGYDPVEARGQPVLEQLEAWDFLRQLYNRAETPAAGLLAATRMYLRFIQMVWLSERRKNDAHQFNPELFFKDELLARAFRSHCQVVKSGPG